MDITMKTPTSRQDMSNWNFDVRVDTAVVHILDVTMKLIQGLTRDLAPNMLDIPKNHHSELYRTLPDFTAADSTPTTFNITTNISDMHLLFGVNDHNLIDTGEMMPLQFSLQSEEQNLDLSPLASALQQRTWYDMFTVFIFVD